jgi:hypothetical protein
MINSGEYIAIDKEMKRLLHDRTNLLKKIWGGLLALSTFLVILFVILFPNQFNEPGTAWILPTYGGIAFVVTLIGFLVSMGYQSEKPYYEYLFKELFEKINLDEGLYLTYTPYDKEAKEFNKVGGLFTRYASVKTKRHVSGVTEEQIPFDIYDCTMITSNGKSSVTHFDGTYFVLHKNVNTILQVRTNGSPNLKGMSYSRLKEFNTVKVYKQEDALMTSVDGAFITFIERLREEEQYSKIFLSVVDGEIHLGLWYRKNPGRKRNDLTIDSVNRYYQYFKSELQLLEQLSQIGMY